MSGPERGFGGPLVGVIGGGQLGRMLGLAGIPLGLRFRFLEPRPGCPAAAVGEVVEAPYDDVAGLGRLAEGAAVVTYEFENVPVEAARRLSTQVPLHPLPGALAMAQDRLVEKRTFRSLGIETAPFVDVASLAELEAGVEELGLPAVLKTRRMGYDGKGQRVLREAGDLGPAWEALGGSPLILEGFVSFARELSILSVRSRSGETAHWPLVENVHREGILVRSVAPAAGLGEGGDRLQERAVALAERVLEHLDYVGVLAIELFEVEGRLLANELAPRVHNSGHWTQDGAETSQFENHLRAVLGLPLGPTGMREGFAAMVNLLGEVPPLETLPDPGLRVHLYGKAPRPGRKLGHLNLVDARRDGLLERVEGVERFLSETQAAQASQSP